MKYHKLVRDNIPEIIKKKGLIPITHVSDDEEYWIKLKDKLKEEVDEFLKENNKEELSDILEVVKTICEFKNINDLEFIREKKAKERGRFKKRIILEEVKE